MIFSNTIDCTSLSEWKMAISTVVFVLFLAGVADGESVEI